MCCAAMPENPWGRAGTKHKKEAYHGGVAVAEQEEPPLNRYLFIAVIIWAWVGAVQIHIEKRRIDCIGKGVRFALTAVKRVAGFFIRVKNGIPNQNVDLLPKYRLHGGAFALHGHALDFFPEGVCVVEVLPGGLVIPLVDVLVLRGR